MYMAYGWPLVIPIEPTSSAAALSDRILYIKTANRLLLVVTPTRIELWSSSQPICVWTSPPIGFGLDALTIYITNEISIRFDWGNMREIRIRFEGRVRIHRPFGAPIRKQSLSLSNFMCDNKSILLGLSNGHLQLVSWNAEL